MSEFDNIRKYIPKGESTAKQRDRFAKQTKIMERKLDTMQTVAVVYGPTPHPEIHDLRYEPNAYKVIWQGKNAHDWPEGHDDKEYHKQEDPKDKLRARIWLPESCEEAEVVLKDIFNIDMKLTNLHN